MTKFVGHPLKFCTPRQEPHLLGPTPGCDTPRFFRRIFPDSLLCFENAEGRNLSFVYQTILATFPSPLSLNALVVVNHREVSKHSLLFQTSSLAPDAWKTSPTLDKSLVMHLTQLNHCLLLESFFTSPIRIYYVLPPSAYITAANAFCTRMLLCIY